MKPFQSPIAPQALEASRKAVCYDSVLSYILLSKVQVFFGIVMSWSLISNYMSIPDHFEFPVVDGKNISEHVAVGQQLSIICKSEER